MANNDEKSSNSGCVLAVVSIIVFIGVGILSVTNPMSLSVRGLVFLLLFSFILLGQSYRLNLKNEGCFGIV
ncbi:hypothetical protein HDE70_001183 [Pedobacter cryoconitis]|nr:hypothetical protein [Pedobacter cryoconitis]